MNASIEIPAWLRARGYAVALALTFASVPLVHLFLPVPLGPRELLVHAVDIALGTLLAIGAIEVLVGMLQRRLDWRFEGRSGMLGLAALPFGVGLAWLAFGSLHDLLPGTRAIRERHVAMGYDDISLRVLPVALLIGWGAWQAVRLANLRRELAEQRAVNRALREHARAPEASGRRITLAHEGGELTVDPASIVRVQAQENYCEFVVRDDGGAPARLVRMTLAEAEALLPGELFVRTHRSHLANLDHVREWLRAGRQASLRLADGAEVPVARSRTGEVRERVRAHLGAA